MDGYISSDTILRSVPQSLPGKPDGAAPFDRTVTNAPARSQPKRRRRRILLGALALTLVLGAGAGWEYWTVWRFEVSTDDAYVKADSVTISPQVSGYLDSVLVTDNQQVKAGDVLATIDARTYQAQLDQATAELAEAEANVQSLQAQLDQQQSLIEEAKQTLKIDEAAQSFASQDDKRYVKLANEGYGSVQRAQQASARIDGARATVAKDQASITAAEQQVAILQANLAQAQASLRTNKAKQDLANTNLGYTILTAPVDGVVGHRALREGLYVEPGMNLLAVVPLQATYVVANFKETQLTGVESGQPAEVEVDTFPGQTIKGVVNSLAPASGQEFALLPPDNATGNFTKIVQRIPVKITFAADAPLAGRLRPGMSVTVTVDTHPEADGKPRTTAGNQ